MYRCSDGILPLLQQFLQKVFLFVSAVYGFLQVEAGFFVVRFDAVSVVMDAGEVIKCHAVFLRGGFFKPFAGFIVVGSHTLSEVIHAAQIGLGFAVAEFCCFCVEFERRCVFGCAL